MLNRRSFMPLLAAGTFTNLVAVSGCQAKSASSISSQIDEAIRQSGGDNFSGNVLVLRKGEVLFRKSFGLADRSTNALNQTASRFAAASLAKPFTAVLTFQLIEEGKLKLSDRLDGVFPELAGKASSTITVEQLLSHTSGIEEATEHHLDRPLVPGDLVAARLTSKPGVFAYSSAGYVVLKLVVEKASGQDYATRLNERIFIPASMKDSGLLRTNTEVSGLALGYAQSGNAPAKLSVPVEILDGAGSLYTTTEDLARFDKALSGNVILSAQSQKIMHTRHTPNGGAAWGYGWALADQGGKYYPWHKGDLPGYTAVMARQIHREELVVILSNQEKIDVNAMRQKILRILKATAES
ncbi:serine hydrolase [Asticcacaulis sp. YBE204]|uniref:serine hydrolase domain-containing protein n=1 Tax=Asticcacaulis sp. YBE204 TaxID=1282363 RepID=UPI0003C3C60E|nr:serine hydrolase domain-containing protein [Asticcacaulis sp. YBE204]ESQ79314.1 hypothetical protein AEYBE204_09910 [Asticcacaulis sp. YBE204]